MSPPPGPDHPPSDAPSRDAETGVANRALLLETLAPILALARRNGRAVALLHVELTARAKTAAVPAAGAFGAVAEAVRGAVRDCDLVGRVEPNAFAIALVEVWEPEAAIRVARRVSAAIGEASAIGVAFFPDDARGGATLLDAAAAAAPAAGGIGFADAVLGQDALRRMELQRDLDRPGSTSQFHLYYQPIRSVETGRVVGAESLLRWDRAGGVLPAAAFIGLAEQSGRIRAIDRWSIQQALTDAAGWRSAGWDGWVAVNLSSRSLADPSLVDVVEGLLIETGTRGDAVVFEITESGAITGKSAAWKVCDGLRGLGARVAVDDFGTGYASFEYLRDFDPDLVKLDRAFVTGGATDRPDRLFPALVELAHRLGKPVVAEGVEDAEELERADASGCEMAQGYLLGRPVDPVRFVADHVRPPSSPESTLVPAGT